MSLNNLLNKHPGKAFVLLMLYFVCVVAGFTWVITPVKTNTNALSQASIANSENFNVSNTVKQSNVFNTVYGDVKLSEKDIECLYTNAYHEARGEGVEGIQAVTLVVLNRTAKKHMGAKTACQTVHKPKQFSWTHLDVKHKPIVKSEMKLVKIAVAALLTTNHSQMLDAVKKVKDSIYYHEKNINWKYKTAFNRIGSIKSHVFYA